MALSPGSRVGNYEVVAPLGAGGMGEVYRAHDRQLDRDVALKILPDALAGDEQRLARFEREAKMLAAVNHSNIAQIFGLVDANGVRGLVMELVPGRTLQGPLPIATALRYAQQIAAALEAAHERGIVHRDLKPGNIIVTPAGTIKVIDFGLAAQSAAHQTAATDASTLTMTAPMVGAILGTPAYMSPEQVRGEAIDKRTDIWAFGVVLYEMLTGKALFEGKTVADTLAAVLTSEPDLSTVPHALRKLLTRCLEKDPGKRLRDIGDAMAMVAEDSPAGAGVPSRAGWMVAAALGCLALAGGIAWWRMPRAATPSIFRVDVDLGQDVALASANGSSTVIVSPDGTRLVYLASVSGGPPKLYARRFDAEGTMELAGTQGANAPFFSPDGQWVGFSLGTRLFKVPVEGGPPVQLSVPGTSTGSAWNGDGFVTTAVLEKGFLKTSANGGDPKTWLTRGEREFTFASPQFLPGGRALLFASYREAKSDPERARVEILSLADQRRTVISEGGVSPRYVATSSDAGVVLFAIRNRLMGQPFDPARLEKRGSPVRLLDDVAYDAETLESRFDIASNGTLVYQKAHYADEILTVIQLLDAAGKRQSISSTPGWYRDARLSPDGKRLVTEVKKDGQFGVEVYDLERDTWTRLATGDRSYIYSVWTADGQFLILGSLTGLYWTRADGAGQPHLLLAHSEVEIPWSVSSDGKRLAYSEGSSNAGQIWTLPLEIAGSQLKAGAPERFLVSDSRDANPSFSPDGKWLAYTSDSSGVDEVYVRAFPDRGAQWKISNGGGRSPVWAGQDLFYQAADRMMAVGYKVAGEDFVPEKARVWSVQTGGIVSDVTRDGKRLLVSVPFDRPNVTRPEHDVVVFQHFDEFLRRQLK